MHKSVKTKERSHIILATQPHRANGVNAFIRQTFCGFVGALWMSDPTVLGVIKSMLKDSQQGGHQTHAGRAPTTCELAH